MKKIFFMVGLASILFTHNINAKTQVPSPTKPVIYQIDAQKSQIQFDYQQMGVTVQGRVPLASGQITWDTQNPANISATAEGDLKKIDTGSAEGDAEVQGAAWFETARFPRVGVRLEKTQKSPKNPNQYSGILVLTMKGKTAQQPVIFTHIPAKTTPLQLTGQFSLSRKSFGIGGGDWDEVLADRVQVRVTIVVK